jgi:hypothetical protein
MDAVQKVSTIAAAGTTYGARTSIRVAPMPFRRGYVIGSGAVPTVNQTELSKQLSFPKPKYGCLNQVMSAGITIAVIFFAFGFLSVHFSGYNFFSYFFILCGSLGILLFLPAALLKIILVSVDKPKREKAFAIWDTLFYCQRDDTVFAPNNPEIRASARQMKSVIGYR